jgi:hypothetical protein
MLADGGECLSDLAVLRDQGELFGPVVSTAMAWRMVQQVAADELGACCLLPRVIAANAGGQAANAVADSVVDQEGRLT